jgi:predicted aldo/keto reductase-like oxidoreductase
MERSQFGNKPLGFGVMRLPMAGGVVDQKETCRMVDTFLDRGFSYFDTAHGYIDGKSELAVRDCLSQRHPRDSFILTDKLTIDFFKSAEDLDPFFESQLKAAGVEWFDFYLMHALTASTYKRYIACGAFEWAERLKAQGKIRHLAMSFHDTPETLEKILSEQPSVEAVQIQFNYNDYEDAGIQSKAVYETCVKFGKPVIVMEPVKGGGLANLPPEAASIFNELRGTNASYALRFASSFDGVKLILSGMSTYEQLEENTRLLNSVNPLNEQEREAVWRARDMLKKQNPVACVACRCCVDGCPQKIAIPALLSCLNSKKIYKDWNSSFYYRVHTTSHGKASSCIGCRKCENSCPQRLPIADLLKETADIFEKQLE